jgi:hypothetical protein
MSFSFEFLNIHITHLAQLPMINMTLKWHHINICNKIANFFGCLTSFLAHLITPNYDNSFSNKSNFKSKGKHYTPINSMIHNFLDVPKIMNHEKIIYFISSSQNFHLLSLFLNKYSNELKFPTLFYG